MIKIRGTGSAAPENAVSNDDLSKIMETNDEWITARTGIRERRISTEDGSTTAMAAEASRKALEQAGIPAEKLDIIILATTTQDNYFPCGACEIQSLLGAVNAVAFDLSAACTGFSFALNTVYSYLKAGIYRTGLVIGSDTLSRIIDWTDRGTCILFGDGAGAVVVESSDEGMYHMVMRADGRKGDALTCVNRTTRNFLTGQSPEMGFLRMNGQEVFRFAVKEVPLVISQLLEESRTDISEVKYFVLHQANLRICEAIAKKLGIPMEKIPINLDKYGNTSAASIPILLDEMNRGGRLEKGDKLVFAGFGAGMTWGAALLEW